MLSQPTFFLPNRPPIATLLIVHGMAEHQGRYRQFAQWLADNGIAVMTFDQLGHGQAAADRQALGFIGNPQPHELMLAHVNQHAEILAKRFENVPHFIMGHSMGSFITRCILQRYGGQFAGAILMGTSAHNPLAQAFVPITELLNTIAAHHTNPIFDTILNKLNNLPFRHEKNLQGFNWLNSNPQRVAEFIADPLCGFNFTNNGYAALMKVMQQGTQKNGWQTVPRDLPILFVSGENDPIGQMGKGIPRIVKQLQTKHFTQISVKQYANMRHEILHEDENDKVYKDILTWLKQSIVT